MRQLSNLERNSVSGGAYDPAAAVVGTALAVIGLALLVDDSYYYTPSYGYGYGYGYGPEVVEVYTPVYDSWGYYQGDIVDTYVYY